MKNISFKRNTNFDNAQKEINEKELIDFCRETLAGFKIPKKIDFCDLPKTSTGKIQKFELRKRAKELS